jgi:endonuclease-3
MTRAERIVEEIGRILPEQTRWHMERFKRFKGKGPFKLLIQIVLSHQTTIRIEDQAIERLWRKFHTPNQLAKATFSEVDRFINHVNYHPTKARRIIAISKAVLEKWKGSMEFLHNLTPERCLDELTSLPGVGRKTASVVLLAIFNKPVMPVDTNVLRVTKELGLVGKKNSADMVSMKLEAMLPRDPAVIIKAHNYLLALGQATSRGRNGHLIDHLKKV